MKNKNVSHLPTITKKKKPDARVSQPHADGDRTARFVPAARKRPKEFVRFGQVMKSVDIQRVFKRGRRIHSASFSLIFLRNSENPGPRLAFVVSRSVSKHAVVRNTLRRRAREWIRKFALTSLPPLDIVILFSKAAPKISRKNLYEELEHTLSQITKK